MLVTRETVLAELTPQEFAAAHGFRCLGQDGIATNPGIAFWVETFTPTSSFKPSKSYATRLKWRAPEGTEHSRLLLASPETVIAIVVRDDPQPRGEAEAPRKQGAAARRPEARDFHPSLATPAVALTIAIMWSDAPMSQ